MTYKAKTRLYVDHALPGSGSIELDKAQTHYLATVLRVKEGTIIHLFNGRDGEWQTVVTRVTRKAVDLLVQEKVREQGQEPDLWLCFAPLKKARIDFLAQKATELGASRLIPVMTSYTQSERVNIDRLKANALEAAEQCERLMVPAVQEPIKFSTLLADWPEDRHILFCDERRDGSSAIEALAPLKPTSKAEKASPWAIFIGPEGGFDSGESEQLRAHKKAVTIALGPRILRADTAAMAALTLWQSVIGDWV